MEFIYFSFLCFERTRTPSKKNIVIPLADITALAKVITQIYICSWIIFVIGLKYITFGVMNWILGTPLIFVGFVKIEKFVCFSVTFIPCNFRVLNLTYFNNVDQSYGTVLSFFLIGQSDFIKLFLEYRST